jgi:squalene synthase HpnC
MSAAGPQGDLEVGTAQTLLPRSPLGADPADILRKAGDENFPVALRLLPARHRRALQAIYAYARMVDDVGDGRLVADHNIRLQLLDELEADLGRVWTGVPTFPVLLALQPTVRTHRLQPQPFLDLLAANRQDLTVTRYETEDDLYAYCRLSADPVGRLVLAVFDATTPHREALSDDVCTALQILEHLQDVGEDRRRGVIYLPQADLRNANVTESDLDAPVTNNELRTVVAAYASKARSRLASGQTLTASLRGGARVAVAGFTAGGFATADALAAADFDVLGLPVRPRRLRLMRHLVALVGRRSSGGDR